MKFKTDYMKLRGAVATIGKAVKRNGINEMPIVKMEVKGEILELSTKQLSTKHISYLRSRASALFLFLSTSGILSL